MLRNDTPYTEKTWGWMLWMRVDVRYVPAATTPATTSLLPATDAKLSDIRLHTTTRYDNDSSSWVLFVSGVSLRLAGLAPPPPQLLLPVPISCLLPLNRPLLHYSLLPPSLYPPYTTARCCRCHCVPPFLSHPSSCPPRSRLLLSTPVSSPLAPPASATARSKRERTSEGDRDNQIMWRRAAFVLV